MNIDHPVPGQEASLRQLWQAVFRDPTEYIEGFFRHAYAPDRCLLAAAEDGQAAAMLYWLDMTCRGRKTAYIYAVATRPQYRGRGLCRTLMDRAHAILAARGFAGAVLVPQNQGLFAMYEKMGYAPCGGIRRLSPEAGDPIALEALGWQAWHSRRKEMLPAGGVELSEPAAEYLGTMAEFFGGEDVLLAALRENGVLHGIELLGSADAAPGILGALDCRQGSFTVPGDTPFAMYRSLDGTTPPPEYFGIAFD